MSHAQPYDSYLLLQIGSTHSMKAGSYRFGRNVKDFV
jgi:hypothetical protein